MRSLSSCRPREASPLLVLLAALAGPPLAGCSDGNAPYQVRESVEQLHVTRAQVGQQLEVVDAAGRVVTSGITDDLGSLVFRKLPSGEGYRVRVTGSAPSIISRRLRVHTIASSQPSADFYASQSLQPGYNYITTRDGTTLSAYVTLPGPAAKGPYPTVVAYSGYDPSKPGEPIGGGRFSVLCDTFPTLCDAPNDSSALLASFFGYATVSVNIRGTGCSGGAYDFFETMQLLDGYDVVETVAAQPWVLGQRVGLVGLSYPGISQLFVGSTRPPHLAAIAPMSVIGSPQTTVRPGGILNDGFGINWVHQVIDRAKPYGQGWEKKRVDGGDTVCAENQLLHGQLIDNVEQARTTLFYDPVVLDPINPTALADRIGVPIFFTSQWQDEQTGPYFMTLLDRFTNAPTVHARLTNGVHVDGYAPETLIEWQAFLELFVAERVPRDPSDVRDLSPTLFETIFQLPLRLPPSRWSSYATVAEAKAAWLAEPPIAVVFETGGVEGQPGAPLGTRTERFASWPLPGTVASRLYLQPAGGLGSSAPTGTNEASQFLFDPEAGQRSVLGKGGNIWDPLPKYEWVGPTSGQAVVFESAPLSEAQVMAGTGSFDLWLRSPVAEADLQVSLSEVRPDGKEVYVQSGWLRASYRGLAPRSTELWPEPTYAEADWAPLVPGEWTQVRVGLPAFAHIFRPGSKVRVWIDTPGGTRSDWRFANVPHPGSVAFAIGHDAAHPSSVALPLLPQVTAPAPLPACPSLRGQPCRDAAPIANSPAQ